MKKIRGFIAVALVASSLFPLTACGKKIQKIDEDDLIDGFEDIFDWDESSDYRENEDYEFHVANYDDPDNPFEYEADYTLQGAEFDDDGTYAYIMYYIMDEDDAAEMFDNYYGAYADGKKDVESDYSKGKYGYYLEVDEDDCFRAMYYSGDMILEISTSGEEEVENVKKLLKDVGLPC